MVEVTLGEYNTALETGDELKMNVTGARVKVHPKFEPRITRVIVKGKRLMQSYAHDIAKLHLPMSVNFTAHTNIVPICLPAEGANFTNVNGTSTGWGWTNRTKTGKGRLGKRKTVLQEFHPNIISRDDCVQKLHAKGILPDGSMLCAEAVKAGACKGRECQHCSFYKKSTWSPLSIVSATAEVSKLRVALAFDQINI
jgi:hypothetical protein